MGPKKKKAPKKTKEELEEERRLQEEEEARVRAEEEKRLEEERKRKEAEEAKRKEEESKNRAAELERLSLEYEQSKADIQGKAQNLAEIIRAKKEIKDWEKYLACEPRPDARVEGDMNSFLNSWLQETSHDMDVIAKSCESANKVVQDLLFVAADARASNDLALENQCTLFIDKIEQMIYQKIESTCAHILQYADEYTDINSKSEVKMASVAERWMKLGLWINLVSKGSRNKRIEFNELGINVELPKAIIIQSLALRLIYSPFDILSSKNPMNVDFALGGILSLDLLAIPPPPKRARGWIMREVTSDSNSSTTTIKRLNYPLEGMVASAALPVKVAVTLPKDILFPLTPRVGWWDGHACTWQEEGINEIVYNPEQSLLTFHTMKLTHLAVIQRRDLNYQKKKWQLKMKSATNHTSNSKKTHTHSAHLTLSTENYQKIQFEITEQGCCLLQPHLDQFQPEEYLSPGELLTRLQLAGLDLCPPIENDGRFGYVPKNKQLEDRAIQEVVSISNAYEVTIGDLSNATMTDAWSYTETPSQIFFQVQEIFWPYLEGNSSNQTDQEHVIEMKETTAGIAAAQAALPSAVNILAEIDTEAIGGVKFRTDKAIDRYQTFVHLKHALEGISSPDAKDRINHANVEFEMVLSKLLSLLRLFSYSKPLNKIVPQAETVFSETSDNDNAITSSGGIEELNASALTGMTLDDPSSNAAAVSDPANGHPSFATDTVASFNGDVTASSGVATDGPSGSASSVVAADIAL